MPNAKALTREEIEGFRTLCVARIGEVVDLALAGLGAQQEATPVLYNDKAPPVDTDRMRFVSRMYQDGSETEVLLFNAANQIDDLRSHPTRTYAQGRADGLEALAWRRWCGENAVPEWVYYSTEPKNFKSAEPLCRCHPMAEREEVTLADCPIGLFMKGTELCLKTEYGNNEGRIDAYIVSSGEFFWGGAMLPEDQRKVLVRPVSNYASSKDGSYKDGIEDAAKVAEAMNIDGVEIATAIRALSRTAADEGEV